MSMIERLKVCLIGATRVGKTSLANRFTHSVFSEDYHTTIGVRIETAEIVHEGNMVQLVIWDLSGEDEFQSVQPGYLQGAAGYLLVVDGTRPITIDTGRVLVKRASEACGNVPFVLVVNKSDLAHAWAVKPEHLDALRANAYAIVETSARSGEGVRRAFELLVEGIFTCRPRWEETRWT
jgi:small GTP-binding protein